MDTEQKALTLWNRVTEDDKVAFDSLYHLLAHGLYQYGLSVTSDPPLVKDALQEIFLDFWQNRKTRIIQSNVRVYMATTLRRKLLRKIKRTSRIVTLPTRNTVEPSHEDILIQIEEEKITRAKMRSAIHLLPNRQREVIHLLYTETHSYLQIVEIMGINKSSVYTLVSKAIKNIQKNLSAGE